MKRRKMTGAALALTVFCAVSGGPFGIEEMVCSTGGGLAILLILVIPLVWALPDALTTAELAAAIPEAGGYVVWVRRAMGPLASFLNGWWSWLYTLVDAALYPVLFTGYLSRLIVTFGGSDVLEKSKAANWVFSALIVVAFTALNVRGARLVGKASSLFTGLIVAPFLVLAGIGLFRYLGHPLALHLSLRPPNGSLGTALSAGLSIAMWNYLGWDALSTVAEEVEEPERAYPRALFLGIPLVTLVYLLPVLAGLAFFPDPAAWKEDSWPEIARAVAGGTMAVVINVAGLVSAVALFTASLLGSSRVPFVLAEGGFLPRALVVVHPRFGTPWKALVLCGLLYVALVYQSFQALVELNVLLYAVALVLELASLLILRRKEPDLPRPYRVPGGWPVLWLLFLMPVVVLGILVWARVAEKGWSAQGPTFVALLSGPVVYAAVRGWQGYVRGTRSV